MAPLSYTNRLRVEGGRSCRSEKKADRDSKVVVVVVVVVVVLVMTPLVFMGVPSTGQASGTPSSSSLLLL